MRVIYAPRRSFPQICLGACTFIGLFLGPTGLGCTSCERSRSRAAGSMAELDQSTCVEQDPPTGQLGRLFEGLCKSSSGQAPSIQAYFLDQSFPRDFFLADILANDSALSECAPGPFLFDNDNEIDAEGKRWKLPSMPNYFVLQLSEGTKDENFYIANQNGFPINCQSFKLRQQENSTLVLVPKTKLEAGKGYYLYLILNQGAMRRTWIQPISLATAND